MPEYVDREAIKKYPIRLNNYDKKNGNYHFVLGIESVMEYVDYLPTADVQEVKHGKWKWFAHDSKAYTCSNCNITQTVNIYKDKIMFNYCPYCGAKMDKEQV